EDLRLVSAERIAPRQSPRLCRPTGLRDPLIPLRRPKRIAGVHLGDHGRVSLKLGPRHGQVFVVEATNSDPSPGQPEGPRNRPKCTPSRVLPPVGDVGLNTVILTSSLISWNRTSSAVPISRASKSLSTTLVIMRAPSSRSTTAATYGTRSQNGGRSLRRTTDQV